MEKEAFQKRLEDLGELAKINNNRLSTDAVKTFLKDMDLTEEQYDLVFAYLASKMITVEGYVPAADQKEGTPELSEEEQTFLTQYEEDLSYLKTVEEEALLELCREVEESGDNDAKARLTEQLLPRVVETAKHYAGRGLPIGDLIQEGNIGLMLALETLGLREEGVSALDYLKEEIEKAVSEALEDQQTELKNTKMDLNKTKEDWENESLAVTQLLVTKTVQVEKGVSLLTQKQSLLERVCKIEEKKQELGFSTGTDLSEKKLAVSEGAKELQSAKDGLTLLKRQLNDLMGREIDEELIITPPELTRTIETAPAYSEELLKTATDKNYKLKTLRRDKQQAEADSKKNDRYDGQLKASRVDMQLADVSTEEEKVNIANDLKKKLDAINTAAAEYQNKKDANSKAKIEWEQQQKSAKLGLVSAVELQALELQYEQTEMELSAAAYAYDLAWEEYTMLMNGTTLDIYDVYKSKLS